jgi:hypothetical protein
VVREVCRLKPDYSLDFELPEVPKPGSYISIQRPDKPEPYGEDLIVRQVWWRLNHPETAGFGSEPPKVGKLTEIMVECEQAIGPYSSDNWRDTLMGKRARQEIDAARELIGRLVCRAANIPTSSGFPWRQIGGIMGHAARSLHPRKIHP